MGFLKFLFGLIILLLIAAALLYFLNKPLFKELQERVLGGIVNSSPGQNKHHSKEKVVHSSTPELQEQYKQIESKVNQALKEISTLQRSLECMIAELGTVSQNVSNLCSQFKVWQERFPQQKFPRQQIPQDVPPRHETQDRAPKQMYAFAPSSSSPYGFNQDDWCATDNGQTFVMRMLSPTEAKFTINNKTEAYSQVLNNLAYLDRLIEYVNNAAEGVKPTRIQSIAIGRLRLQGSVWTIQNRIKITIN